MQTERHRARRFPFHAYIEVTDVQAETQTRERTRDLSVFGCQVDALKPSAPGTKVNIKISHVGEIFQAQGRVAYARPGVGMGIVFTGVSPGDQLVLEDWIADLRKK